MATPRIIVVGGGLAGLVGRHQDRRDGRLKVDLFSIVPVKRSHSVCAQGGINAAKNLKGEGDTTYSTSTTPSMAATFWPTRRL
jgi:succinate dehydrogenase / fumarate reductase flavoprotein subunit